MASVVDSDSEWDRLMGLHGGCRGSGLLYQRGVWGLEARLHEQKQFER